MGIIMRLYPRRDGVLTSVTGENESGLVIGGGVLPISLRRELSML